MSILERGSVAAVVTTLFCAQAQVITTFAGTDFTFPPTPLAARNAPTGQIIGVAIDPSGNTYLADSTNDVVFKINQQGVLTTVAGNGILGFSGDGGPATSAALNVPYAVAVHAAGNVSVADGNERIRKVPPAGIISTVAGNGTSGYSGDGGPAT